MRRVLIAIGCDAHMHLKPLTGAVNDAERVFDALIRVEAGDYDPKTSVLLRSPTLQDARDAFKAALFDGGPIDTLSIFFAGHGAVSAGSFYMAFRDTRVNALSATAISLGEMLRMVAEAAPTQTYMIVDACEAGGLIADLNVILKSEVLGRSGTPGLTLLAMAAADETAEERSGEGVGTNALLECITGKTFLQDSRPTLDLVEIGRSVSERICRAGLQSPVVWGLNLVGAASFCRNPHAGTGNAPLRSVLEAWTDPESEAVVRAFLPRLWEPYVTVSARWIPRAFLDHLAPVLAEVADKPVILAALAQRISDAFAARAVESADRFREIEVRAACAVALLPYADKPEIEAFLERACIALAEAVLGVLRDVDAAVAEDRFALLNGGLAELYFLPLRLTRLLGWIGFASHALAATGAEMSEIRDLSRALLTRFFEHYGLSLVAMSDAQAPSLALSVTSLVRMGLKEEAERLVGYMFASFVACGGRPARPDIEPEKILAYLLARQNGELGDLLDLVAQPTELGTVIVRSAALIDLAEPIDEALEGIDHVAINAYIAADFSQFGDYMMRDGGNATYTIGQDIWTVGDLEAQWPTTPAPPNRGLEFATMLAALLLPDRTPWFLYPPGQSASSGPAC